MTYFVGWFFSYNLQEDFAMNDTSFPGAPEKVTSKSWKAEVVTEAGGNFAGNAVRFATAKEAEEYVADLAFRWILVRATRVVPSDDPVNYRWNGTDIEPV